MGYHLKLHGKAERSTKSYWDVEVISPSGFSKHVYIDPETDLISHDIRTSALHPDIDPEEIPQVSYYSEYRDVDGLKFSTRSVKENLRNGDIMQTANITSIRLNPKIDHRIFDIPE